MWRALTVLALGAVSWTASLVVSPPGEAHACSLVSLPAAIPYLVDKSEVVIAIGRFESPSGDRIGFRVTEGLRGARSDDVLSVNNRELELGASCGVSLRQPAAPRFSAGQSALLFLERDDLGVADLRPAHYGYGVAILSADGMSANPQLGGEPFSLQVVRDLVARGPQAGVPATGAPGSASPEVELPAGGADSGAGTIALVIGGGAIVALGGAAGYWVWRRRRTPMS